MFDDSERQWLYNPTTGGYFHCPLAAVDDWKGRGFEESDPPEEVDQATVELLAWREEQAKTARKSTAKTAADDADDEAKPKPPSKATKPTAVAKSEEN